MTTPVPDSPPTVTELLNSIERLLVQGEPDVSLRTCWFSIGLGETADTSGFWSYQRSNKPARRSRWTATTAPKAHLGGHFKRASNGTITERTWTPPPPPDPPIQSNESLTNLGDENHVWRGYGNNTRGVIKL